MIEPLIQLGQWINTADHSLVFITPLLFGLINPRWGFVSALTFFCMAWWFV